VPVLQLLSAECLGHRWAYQHMPEASLTDLRMT